MAVTPRRAELKAFGALLEQEYPSPSEAATELLKAAYALYEGQAKWWVVGQVKPNIGWATPEEGRDAKLVLGPFGTRRQAELAGHSLAVSSSTGEEASWWAVEAWYGTPAAWYTARKAKWKKEVTERDPRTHRLSLVSDWLADTGGAPLPEPLVGEGWAGLDEFQEWVEEGAILDENDLRAVIRSQQATINDLRKGVIV